MQYCKFFAFHILASLGIVSFLLGGIWIVVGFVVTTSTIVLGDLQLGDDISEPEIKQNWPYNLQLWLALPLLSILLLSAMHQFGGLSFSGKHDASEQPFLLWLSAVLYCGLLIGTLGTVTAHELIHRRWGSFSHTVGRWLLAFSFDSNFAIEHVFGHHLNIATEKDPASAPRGRNVYYHILHSTWFGNVSAWRIEQQRLKRQKRRVLTVHNRFIAGLTISLLLTLVSYLIAGPKGCLFFVLSALIAKSLLEVVNYMEHYGLVRLPGKRVFPRHSWNSNNKISSWALFNLTRHSHHHANANVPFQYLKPVPDAPMMPSGYLGTLGLTLIPPLWYKIMQPRLAHWDDKFASDEERAWLQKQA